MEYVKTQLQLDEILDPQYPDQVASSEAIEELVEIYRHDDQWVASNPNFPWALGYGESHKLAIVDYLKARLIPRNESRDVAGAPLAQRVRRLREAYDWSLTELAERAGIARSYLHQIEQDKSSPTYDKILELCRALRVRPAALVDGFYDVGEDIERISGKQPEERDGVVDLRRHTIEMLEEEEGGEVVDREYVAANFPDLAEWSRRLQKWNCDNLIFVKTAEDIVRVLFFTHDHRYVIVARLPDDDDGWLGGYANARTARPGETWIRGNDLPDGPYSEETFNEIVAGALAYETESHVL